jgi:hypothetical protein
MEEMDRLAKKLKKGNVYDKKRVLAGVYKQLAVSNKGKQANGEYRKLSDDFDLETAKFVSYVAENLHDVGMVRQANKLTIQYGMKMKKSGEQSLNEFYIDRTFGDSVPAENRERMLKAMEKYSGNAWWESKDPVEVAKGQIDEELLLVPYGKFIEGLEGILGRGVMEKEMAEGYDYELLKKRAKEAINSMGKPVCE